MSLSKSIFDKLSNETHFVGLSFEKGCGSPQRTFAYARTFASLAIDGQENMRFCRAEMPSYCVKALENTQSILCGLFPCLRAFLLRQNCFASDSLGFSRDFCSFDAGGLSPAKEKKGKKHRKDWLSDAWVSLPVDGLFSPTHMSPEKMVKKLYLRLRAQTLRGFFRQAEGTGLNLPVPFFNEKKISPKRGGGYAGGAEPRPYGYNLDLLVGALPAL